MRIGEDITITVLRVIGSQVRLGVNAPKNVSVQREEISGRAGGADGAPAPDDVPAGSGG